MSAAGLHHIGCPSRAKVWVRTKPTCNFAPMIRLQPDHQSIHIHCPKDESQGYINNKVVDWAFKLDGVLHDCSQDEVYSTVASEIVTAGLGGFNGTLMCYGQTGAGKTFTMTGATEIYQHRGIIPRALAQLYQQISCMSDLAVTVRISFLEIYNETMFDLLATLPESLCSMAPLSVAEDDHGVYVKGLQSHVAHNEEEALNMLFEGETNRAIACHTLNSQSSRSHCIFTVYIESKSRVDSNAQYTLSKLNFVDLAGSERLGKTQSEGKTKQEAMYINKSLSFLEQTIISLADRRVCFVPFRQCKLTHFLKDSLGGSAYTRLIANIWTEPEQLEETISTLRFATRMMCVPVQPVVNTLVNPLMRMQNLEHELMVLKKELAMHDILTNRTQVTYDPLTDLQREEIRETVASYIENRTDGIEVINLRQIQGVFEAFKQYIQHISEETENKLRAQYNLTDKTSATNLNQQKSSSGVNLAESGDYVGEADLSSGFGVGPASGDLKVAPSNIIAGKKRDAKKPRKDRQSPVPQLKVIPKAPAVSNIQSVTGGKTSQSDSQSVQSPSLDKDEREEREIVSQQTEPQIRPSTPPSKSEAFEDFKRNLGSEIYRILAENKDVLAGKKQCYSQLAKQINCTKDEIDRSLERLSTMTKHREAQGPTLNEDGDTIISEAEYLEITRLKDLKSLYRNNFDELKGIKSEVQYCQKLVDQCRQRLVQEFEKWYADNFVFGIPTLVTQSAPAPVVSDEQDKFDKMQMSLMLAHNPDSVPFYSAQLRTQRRKVNAEGMIKLNEAAAKKPVGPPVRTLRHKLPTTLQVQQ